MPSPKAAIKKIPFSRVKEARDALAGQAVELIELYKKIIVDAAEAQDFKVAAEGIQFLLEHMPKGEDGSVLLDPSVDKAGSGPSGPTGPTIQIGIALGETKPKALLPASSSEVIDITKKND